MKKVHNQKISEFQDGQFKDYNKPCLRVIIHIV